MGRMETGEENGYRPCTILVRKWGTDIGRGRGTDLGEGKGYRPCTTLVRERGTYLGEGKGYRHW